MICDERQMEREIKHDPGGCRRAAIQARVGLCSLVGVGLVPS
jgi:hypothetical protein